MGGGWPGYGNEMLFAGAYAALRNPAGDRQVDLTRCPRQRRQFTCRRVSRSARAGQPAAVMAPGDVPSTGSTSPAPWSSWWLRLIAALIRERWLKACGK